MKIQIVLESADHRSLIKMLLEKHSEIELVENEGDSAEAIAVLNKEQPDLLIFDQYSKRQEFVEHLIKSETKTPFLLCDEKKDPPVHDSLKRFLVRVLPSGQMGESLEHVVAHFDDEMDRIQKAIEEDYLKVNSKHIYSGSPIDFPVFYFQKPNKISEIKRKDSEISRDIVLRSIGRDPLYLFVRKEDAKAYIMKQKSLLVSQSKKIENEDEKFEFLNASYTSFRELVNKVGFNQDALEVAQTSVELATQALSNTPSIGQIIAAFRAKQDAYLTSHSILLAEVGCSILSGMEDNLERNYTSMVYAAFLHDITLTNDKIAQIQTKRDLNRLRDQFTEEEYFGFIDHPTRAAKIASKIPNCPKEVADMVVQHHEQANGHGFPEGIDFRKILPLSAIFIVAHELVLDLMKNEESFDLDQFVKKNRFRFGKSNFRRVFFYLKQSTRSKEDRVA